MAATLYTDFTCQSGGSNLNAGTTLGVGEEGTSPRNIYSNGSNSGGVFTVASGNPSTDGVIAGMFASMYIDGGSPPTATPFVGRITNVTSTTITVTAGSAGGALPASGSNRTLRVGGAWAGPNTTDQAFPLGLATLYTLATLTTFYPLRVNFKNNQTYTVSAATTVPINGPFTMQGYTTTFGDGGRATLTGGTSGASFNLLNFSATNAGEVRDFIFKNNGATGSAHGVVAIGRPYFKNCIFTGMLGAGFNGTSATSANAPLLHECEVYGNNTSGTASFGGIVIAQFINLVRCFIHDNTGGNTAGLFISGIGGILVKNCIFSGNGSHGIAAGTSGCFTVTECDFYNNGGSGIGFISTISNLIGIFENCNFLKNGAWGINFNTFNAAATGRFGTIANCGFGVGTQANASGNINTASNGIGNMQEIGHVDYATGVTPWNDPANGDFTITLAAAQGQGRMSFIETSASLSAPNTTGSIDIGAANHLAAGGSGPVARFVSAQRGTPY